MAQASLRAVLLFALLCLAAPALAWQGRAVNPAGEPVEDARIRVLGHPGEALTDEDGLFDLPGALVPPLTLLVELADGTSLAVGVPALERGRPTRLLIDPSLFESVETWALAEADLDVSPGTLSSPLPLEEAASEGDTSIQQALARLPSTPVPSADPDQVPSLRGLERGRTLTVVDGGSVEVERRAGFSSGQSIPATLGAVEVARGPNGVLYGSAAMGGVIALRSPWALAAAAPRASATIQAAFGGAPSVGAWARWQESGWSVAAGLRAADDPEDASGRALEGEFEQRSAFVGKTWKRGETTYRLGARWDRLQDAERLSEQGDASRTLVPRDELGRLVFRAESPGRHGQHAWSAWLGRAKRETRLGIAVDALGTTTKQRELGGRWTLQGGGEKGSWTIGAQLSGRFGVDVESDVDGDESAALLLPKRALDSGLQARAAVFGFLAQPLGKGLSLHLGGRGERIASEADAGGESYSERAWATTGSAALVVELGAAGSVSLQLANGYREPLLTERFLVGITGRGIALANPALDPERSLQWDLAWRGGGRLLRGEAAIFRYEIDDVVVREFLGEDELPADLVGLPVDVYRFANRGEAVVEGLELAGTLRLPWSARLRVAAHVLRGEDGEGVPLESLPQDGLTLSYRQELSRTLSGGATLFLRARDDELAEREAPRPGYGLLNISLRYRIGEALTLGVGIRNALDKDYRLGTRIDDPRGPGRTALVSLEWSR